MLQQARIFNDSHINSKKCRILLTKIVFLLYTSEPLSVQEATDLFFNVIKLFSSKDVSWDFQQSNSMVNLVVAIDIPAPNDVPCHQGAFRYC